MTTAKRTAAPSEPPSEPSPMPRHHLTAPPAMGTRYSIEVHPGGVDPRTGSAASRKRLFEVTVRPPADDSPFDLEDVDDETTYPSGTLAMWNAAWAPYVTLEMPPLGASAPSDSASPPSISFVRDCPTCRHQDKDSLSAPCSTCLPEEHDAVGWEPRESAALVTTVFSVPSSKDPLPPEEDPTGEIADHLRRADDPSTLPVEHMPAVESTTVRLAEIYVEPGENPRTEFDHGKLFDLGEHLKAVGQVNELVCDTLGDGRLRLLAGERRLRALTAAGATRARVRLFAGTLSTRQAWLIRAENASHEPLSILDEAREMMQGVNAGCSTAEVARVHHCSSDVVQRRLRLLTVLPPAVQQLVRDRKLYGHQANELTKDGLTDDQRIDLATRAAEEDWSEREMRDAVNAIVAPPMPVLPLGDQQPLTDGTEGTAKTGGVCRVCGCTKDHPCAGGCTWVDDDARDLCSVCGDLDGKNQGLEVLARFGLDMSTVGLMAEGGLDTVGDLAGLTLRKGTFWYRDVNGIGEAAAGRIDDALAKFHFARVGTTPAVAADLPPETGSSLREQVPPADSKWKLTHVSKLDLQPDVEQAFVKAGLWCAGLVWDRSVKMGEGWHQGVGLDLTAEQAQEVLDAIRLLWPMPPAAAAVATRADQEIGVPGPTADHDQVNQRRADRVAQAPIVGTKSQTAAERHEQAKSDSDARSSLMTSASIAMKFSGKASGGIVRYSASSGSIQADQNLDFTVTIAGQAFRVGGTLTLDVKPELAKRMFKAASDAHKKPLRVKHNGGARKKR